MVGTAGFEPTTSASRTLRATKLRHVPIGGSVSEDGFEARFPFKPCPTRNSLSATETGYSEVSSDEL